MFILVLKLIFLFISQQLNLLIPAILDPKAPGEVPSCISLRSSSLKYNDRSRTYHFSFTQNILFEKFCTKISFPEQHWTGPLKSLSFLGI